MPEPVNQSAEFTPVLINTPRGQVYARSQFELERELAAGATMHDYATSALPYEQEFRSRMQDEEGEALLTGAANALSGGIFEDDSYRGKVIAEENPIAAGAGYGLGLVGGAVAGVGIPGLAAKVGSSAARVAASPMAKLAIEGAVDGLSHATMREGVGAIVHDKPFSVEAIALEGALGGGIGAGIGAAAKGAGALRKALTKEDIAKDVVAKAMSGVDEVPVSAPGEVPPGIDPSAFDSTLPVPKGANSYAVTSKPSSIEIQPIPSLENPAKFYSSMPHMKGADDSLHKIWKEMDTLEDDIARMPGDTVGFDDLNAEWGAFKESRARLAKMVGGKPRKTERISELQKYIKRWDLPESPIADKMDLRSPAKNQELIDAFEDVIASARRIDSKLDDIRARGEHLAHIDVTADIRGASVRLDDKLSKAEQVAAVAERRAAYAAEVAGKERSPTDDLIREIFAKDTGSLQQKLPYTPNKVSNLKQFKNLPRFERTPGVRQTADAERDAALGYVVPEAWNTVDARPLAAIEKAIEAGEPPHLDELLMLNITDQRKLLDSLSQKHIDSLAAEAYNNPKIITYKAQSTSITGPAIEARRSIVGALEEDMLMARLQPPAPTVTPGAAKRPNLHATAPAPTPIDGASQVRDTGIGVIDMLNRTNLAGLAFAGMFPKMALAKVVVEKYGARIAGAAEKALSNRPLGVALRKVPALPWANVLAPGGSDHDRNLRAVAEAAKNPAAFDAAVEQAMMNIDSDNPEKMVEARERISVNLQYLIRNMPPVLSALRPVWSASSVAAFNVLMKAFADPVGVFEEAATAPTQQINAAKEMYPETYMHWMTELVNKVAEAAAAGKPIPRHIGRFMPMASPAWSPGGMSMLQTVTTEKVQGGGDQMDSSVMAPKTDVEAMSQNRIGLNK